MRPILNFTVVLFVAFLFTMCDGKQKNETKNTTSVTENFDWLLGKWKRVNEQKGKETFENWEKINPNQYNGIGFTMQNKDTVSQEQMTLVKSDGVWRLMVKILQEKEITTFEMTEFTDEEFACNNDTLDFPKQIRYWKDCENLKAIVAGDSLKILFEFEKIK